GLAFQLPPPLDKPAEQVLAVRYENAMVPSANRPLDMLSIQIGELASLQYLRDVGGDEPQVLRGAIGVGVGPGEAVEMPAEGVLANVQLGALRLDPWEDVIARAAGAPAATPADAPWRGGDGGAAGGYLPTVLAIRAKEISAEGRSLHNVVMGG